MTRPVMYPSRPPVLARLSKILNDNQMMLYRVDSRDDKVTRFKPKHDNTAWVASEIQYVPGSAELEVSVRTVRELGSILSPAEPAMMNFHTLTGETKNVPIALGSPRPASCLRSPVSVSRRPASTLGRAFALCTRTDRTAEVLDAEQAKTDAPRPRSAGKKLRSQSSSPYAHRRKVSGRIAVLQCCEKESLQ